MGLQNPVEKSGRKVQQALGCGLLFFFFLIESIYSSETTEYTSYTKVTHREAMRLRDLVVDYLIDSTQCGMQDRDVTKETYGDSVIEKKRKESLPRRQWYVQSPRPKAGGFQKFLPLSEHPEGAHQMRTRSGSYPRTPTGTCGCGAETPSQ